MEDTEEINRIKDSIENSRLTILALKKQIYYYEKQMEEEFNKIKKLCHHEFVTEREPIPYGEKITFCKKCNYCI